MFIDVTQLKVLSNSGVVDQINVKAIEIEGKKVWKLLIVLKDKTDIAVLISQKKKIRYWTQLNSVITFIDEFCPSIDCITIFLNKKERRDD